MHSNAKRYVKFVKNIGFEICYILIILCHLVQTIGYGTHQLIGQFTEQHIEQITPQLTQQFTQQITQTIKSPNNPVNN